MFQWGNTTHSFNLTMKKYFSMLISRNLQSYSLIMLNFSWSRNLIWRKNWLFYENRDYDLDFWSLFLHNGGQVASFSRIKILVSKLISSSVFTFRFKIRISIRKPYRLHVLLNCDEIHKETRRPNSLSTRTWFWIMNWD